MKKLTALLLTLVLCMTSMTAALAKEALVGGWTATDDPTVPQEVSDALARALTDSVGATIEPVALLGTQVVAGMNYCILCRVSVAEPTEMDGSSYTLAYLYVPLSGDPELTGFHDLDIAELAVMETAE